MPRLREAAGTSCFLLCLYGIGTMCTRYKPAQQGGLQRWAGAVAWGSENASEASAARLGGMGARNRG